MKKIVIILILALTSMSTSAKTLVAYYSFTNNVHNIVNELLTQIDADVIRIEPSEKGLDYAANGYALGTQLLNAIKANPESASSYPEIDPVDVNLDDYGTVIIATPLWWSQMAAPMQTYLFNNRSQLAGKNICLIVSSGSSGISGVETDAKRLLPDGTFITPSLWIRSSQISDSNSLISDWLNEINFNNLTQMESNKLYLTVGNTTLTATLVNNSSTVALIELLKKGDVTIHMSDYGNMEKVGDLPQSLPRNDEQISTVPGDLILYLGRSFVIYYDTNSWNFTRLGKIDGITSGTELKSILGNGDVDVILSLSSSADIKDITSNNHTSHDIYDINGRRVSASDCSMPSPGIYIIDGIKKVLK